MERPVPLPALPDALPPAGQDFLCMRPGVQLPLDSLLRPDPAQVVDDAVAFVKVEMPPAPVLVPRDGYSYLEVCEVGRGERLAGADDVLGVFPVGVPSDGDGVGEVVLGDGQKRVEKLRLDDLVAVGQEGVGVAEGEEVLPRRLSVLDLAAPLADDDRRARCLGCRGGALPVSRRGVEREAVHEDERWHSALESGDSLCEVETVVMRDNYSSISNHIYFQRVYLSRNNPFYFVLFLYIFYII